MYLLRAYFRLAVQPVLLALLIGTLLVPGLRAADLDDPPRALVKAVEAALAEAFPAQKAEGRYAGLALAVAASLNEDAKLTASDAGANDFGAAVSLWGDRALIGAPGGCPADNNCGAAYVFAFDGTSWKEEAKLIASDPTFSFGESVSLSGHRALIGAGGDSCGTGTICSAAYVFEFDGMSWKEEAKLTASDADAFDQFGRSVSLSSDLALIGASSDDCAAGNNCGAAYVFAFDGTSWKEEAKLTASDADFIDALGRSVSLSGNRALLGAPGDICNDGSIFCGAAYFFDVSNQSPVTDAGLDQVVLAG